MLCVWPELVELVITEPPGPNVVWTGVMYPDERPGLGAAEPRVGLANVDEGGRDDDEEVPGPVEEPGRPGLGLKAMGLMTTLPCK